MSANAATGDSSKKEGGEKKEVLQVEINQEDFDLDSYISNYEGHGKISRLIFIAEHCKALELDAFRMAIDELKKTTNTSLYKSVVEKLGDRLGPSYALDTQWIEATDKKAAGQLERLELELNGYKTNLIKESIRLGHSEIGDFHYQRGELTPALKAYVRTRDYCSTSQHIIRMCLNVIRVSIEMGNYSHVVNYVSKAEQTPDISKDPVVVAQLKVSAGLAQLESKKYKLAAKKFLETTIDLGHQFAAVVAPQDVAIYGGLCALATFDRSELKKKVLDNVPFRSFLELVPQVRELINDFYGSRYASCLSALERLQSILLLDPFLHSHVISLIQKIRNKALVQYFSPFVSVDLNTMAEAFNTSVSGLEKELAALIMEDLIQARIDSHNKRLYARTTDQRSATFAKTLSLGESYQDQTQTLLLRVDLLRNEFTVKPQRGEKKM